MIITKYFELNDDGWSRRNAVPSYCRSFLFISDLQMLFELAKKAELNFFVAFQAGAS